MSSQILGQTETLPTEKLTTYYQNPRRGDTEAIAESLRVNGQFRPLVVNKGTHTGRPYEVLAGNHTLLAARSLDGTDDAFPRLDAYVIDVDEDHARRIVLADNRTSDLATYDDEALLDILETLDDTAGTGFDTSDLDSLSSLLALQDEQQQQEARYTNILRAPLYEPTSDTPPRINDIINTSKTQELQKEIKNANLPEDISNFLYAAAERHTVIDFQQVAEYYAHATPEIQKLMEDQALVIVDSDRAIELGYLHLEDAIYDQRVEDNRRED